MPRIHPTPIGAKGRVATMARRLSALARRVRQLDRRGGTAALIAVTVALLIGMAGLAIDAGTWYLTFRNAETAADLAAMAGATAASQGRSATAAATDTATRNGFVAGSQIAVTVNSPPQSGAQAGNAAAVEVIVTQSPTLNFARLFLASAPTIRSRAVAAATPDDPVCVLALAGGLDLGGNKTSSGTGCALGADAASAGIQVTGAVRAHSLYTTGDCSGCTGGDVWTDDSQAERPAVGVNRPLPSIDPFASLQGWIPTVPACRTGQVTFTANQATLSPGQAICASVTVGSHQTLTLNPGIYYFRNADLVVQNQGTLNGSGVTLVFTGTPDQVGTLQFKAQAAGSLRGPAASQVPGYPAAAGLLVYRDAAASIDNGGDTQVRLESTAMTLFGSFYLPSSNVSVNGNAGASPSTCFEVIGYQVTVAGRSDTRVDVTGCAGFTAYATIRTVRLQE